MARSSIKTTTRQTCYLLFKSSNTSRTSIRHAERSIQRWKMSNWLSYLSNWTRKFVILLLTIFWFLLLFLFRGANHSDPYHYQCCSGFYIDIFNILKDRLKFEFELYQVHDRIWGARNPLTVIMIFICLTK